MGHQGLKRAGALVPVGGTFSQSGTQIGKGVQVPGYPFLPALRTLADASHWLNPTQSQLARVPKSYRHPGVRQTEQGMAGWRMDKEGAERKWEVVGCLF